MGCKSSKTERTESRQGEGFHHQQQLPQQERLPTPPTRIESISIPSEPPVHGDLKPVASVPDVASVPIETKPKNEIENPRSDAMAALEAAMGVFDGELLRAKAVRRKESSSPSVEITVHEVSQRKKKQAEEAINLFVSNIISVMIDDAATQALALMEEKRIAAEAKAKAEVEAALVRERIEKRRAAFISAVGMPLDELQWDKDLIENNVMAGFAQALIVNNIKIADMIQVMDDDTDGVLSLKEFKAGIATLGMPISEETSVEKLFTDIDSNQDGKLSYLELSSMRNDHRDKNESQLKEAMSMSQVEPEKVVGGPMLGTELKSNNSAPKAANISSSDTTSKRSPKTKAAVTKSTKSKKDTHALRQAYIKDQLNKKKQKSMKPTASRDISVHMKNARSISTEKRIHPFLDKGGTGTPPRQRKNYSVVSSSVA